MKVRILSEIGENTFELKESAVFALLSAALTLQNGGTAVVEPNATYVSNAEAKQAEPVVAVAEPMKPKSEAKKSRLESMFGPDWKKEATPAPAVQSESIPEDEDGYKGFLLMKCPHCGEIKGFCSKVPLRYYKCNQCEGTTELKGLRKAFIKCECGKNFKYMTNITDEQFTYNCVSCGSPVELQYNSKKNIYQTMM